MNGRLRTFGLAIALTVFGIGAAGVAPAGAIVPPINPGCGLANSTWFKIVDLPYVDGGVVSQSIDVAGVTGPIWDLDVRTGLGHNFSADLDVTLTSPAGTVVTLTSDNGGNNDDVFDGTTWDDQAGDGVVDHIYTNGVHVPTLSPEEPLSAFNGQDANGTWTLTISDDSAADTGSLFGFWLELTTFTGPLMTYQAVSINPDDVPIPDPGTIQETVDVLGLDTIVDVEVLVDAPHEFAADLDLTLTSPEGTDVTLSSDNGAGFDNVFTPAIFDDQANPGGQVPYVTNNGMVTDNLYANNVIAGFLTPEEPLGALRGENPNGTWTLTVTDDTATDDGTLLEFGVQVTTGTCSPPPDLPTPNPPLPEPPVVVPPTGHDVDVIAGADRVGTAIKVSQASFANGAASAVVLARRDAFPDALAGTPLAAAKGGPMLLTSPTALENDVADEIDRVLGGGGDVYLLGGTAALSPAVASALTSSGYTVHRLAGENRFETAVEIAESLGNPQTVLEASGLDFPDAVSAGAAAIEAGAAVLLTNGAAQSAATAAYLAANPDAARFAVGGPAAAADPTATGLVGFDRFETSAMVATRFFPSPTVAGVASGRSFPDALTGGVQVGVLGGPMLLTEPGDLPAPVTDFLDANFQAISNVFVYGGPAAVGAPVIEEIAEAIS